MIGPSSSHTARSRSWKNSLFYVNDVLKWNFSFNSLLKHIEGHGTDLALVAES